MCTKVHQITSVHISMLQNILKNPWTINVHNPSTKENPIPRWLWLAWHLLVSFRLQYLILLGLSHHYVTLQTQLVLWQKKRKELTLILNQTCFENCGLLSKQNYEAPICLLKWIIHSHLYKVLCNVNNVWYGT